MFSVAWMNQNCGMTTMIRRSLKHSKKERYKLKDTFESLVFGNNKG